MQIPGIGSVPTPIEELAGRLFVLAAVLFPVWLAGLRLLASANDRTRRWYWPVQGAVAIIPVVVATVPLAGNVGAAALAAGWGLFYGAAGVRWGIRRAGRASVAVLGAAGASLVILTTFAWWELIAGTANKAPVPLVVVTVAIHLAAVIASTERRAVAWSLHQASVLVPLILGSPGIVLASFFLFFVPLAAAVIAAWMTIAVCRRGRRSPAAREVDEIGRSGIQPKLF